MSTQFRTATTDEWVGTRFFGGAERGGCFDFGADRSAVVEVKEACDAGETFVGDDSGKVLSGAEFWSLVSRLRWTFGEFGGTFELGKGDVARFQGLR